MNGLCSGGAALLAGLAARGAPGVCAGDGRSNFQIDVDAAARVDALETRPKVAGFVDARIVVALRHHNGSGALHADLPRHTIARKITRGRVAWVSVATRSLDFPDAADAHRTGAAEVRTVLVETDVARRTHGALARHSLRARCRRRWLGHVWFDPCVGRSLLVKLGSIAGSGIDRLSRIWCAPSIRGVGGGIRAWCAERGPHGSDAADPVASLAATRKTVRGSATRPTGAGHGCQGRAIGRSRSAGPIRKSNVDHRSTRRRPGRRSAGNRAGLGRGRSAVGQQLETCSRSVVRRRSSACYRSVAQGRAGLGT